MSDDKFDPTISKVYKVDADTTINRRAGQDNQVFHKGKLVGTTRDMPKARELAAKVISENKK